MSGGFGGGPRGKGPAQRAPRHAAYPVAWITKCRRLDHDYERLPEHSEAMIKWAMIGLMTRRLAPGPGRRPWQPSTSTRGFPNTFLLLGPLYHLPEREDRLQALREARRVARPGAPVVAAGISRYATLMDIGSDGRLTEAVEPFLHRLHATGQFRGDVVGFATAYFHFPDELAQDLVDAGLRDVEVYGIERPAGPTLRALGMDCLDERLDAAVRAARIVERDPMMIAASGHLLAVGRV